MSNQIVISSGAKVRSLEGVLTGTAGIVNSVPLGGANGVATLDALGKVPLSQLPASVVTYLGTWNAATNTPTLTNGVGDTGDLYICNVAGTVNFGAGPITFAAGDWVIYSGTEWQKSAGASGTVTSVALTESGDALTITGSPITTSGTINIGFAGTGSQYIKGNGTLATFPTTIDQAKRLITEVYNSTGATLTKGTVVYINGGQGNLPTVTKAQANNDANSAQTYGVVQDDITNNNNGFVVVLGSLTDLDTSAYVVGTQLYLSGTTAGAWTSTKPSAPIHLVYVAIVVRSHPTQGVVEVRIQNGYELEELHDVAISVPVNNQGIFYNSSNDLWENKSIATALGYTPANDALVVKLAGTQTITGQKTFSTTLFGTSAEFSSSILSPIVSILDSSTYTKVVRLQTLAATNRDVYFPDLNGTVTLLEGTQTFTGLKSFDAALNLKVGAGAGGTGYIGLGSITDNTLVVYNTTSGTTYSQSLAFPTGAGNTYTFPNLSGTLALLEGTQTFTGSKTFGGAVSFNFAGSSPIVNYGLALVKGNTPPVTSGAWSNIYASSGNNNLTIIDTNNTSVLQFQGSSSYTYTFPAATGTIALTSNLSSYVPYTGATGNVNLGTYSLTAAGVEANSFSAVGSGSQGGYIYLKQGSTPYAALGGSNGISAIGTKYLFIADAGSGNSKIGLFELGSLSNNTARTYTLPDASGTLALSSDLSSYVPYTGATSNLNLGTNALLASTLSVLGSGTTAGYLSFTPNTNQAYSAWTSVAALGDSALAFSFSPSAGQKIFNFDVTGLTVSTMRTYTMPNASGTLVLGTGTTNYLPKFTGASTLGDSLIFDNGTNVGIGTATPTLGKLQIQNSGADTLLNVNNTTTNGSGLYFTVYTSGSLVSSGRILQDNSGNMRFGTGTTSDTERMRITSTGNVGIGTSSPTNPPGFSRFLNISGTDAAITISNTNGTAKNWTLGALESGNFLIADGTTERMRITSIGRVGVNTSSPAALFEVRGTGNSAINSHGNLLVSSGGTATQVADTGGQISFGAWLNGDLSVPYPVAAIKGVSESSTTDVNKGALLFCTMNSTTNAERMRLNSSGNLGIGVTPFASTNERLVVRAASTTSSDFALVVQNSSGFDLLNVRADGLFNTGTRSLSPYNFDPGGRVMYVNSLGQMGSTSSTRESKIHINPITSVDYIMQLNPVSFYHRIQDTETRTYTDEYFDEIKYGFIADEVEKVNLDLVFYNENEDGTKKLAGVEYMSMIAVLTKAIQELSAKVTALENKS